MKHNIFFLGAGNIAQALAYILRDNKNINIQFWDKDAKKVPNQRPIKELAKWGDIIFLCVNSWVMREAVLSISKHIKKESYIFTVAKGIEDTTGLWMHEVIEELLYGKNYGLVSGPMLAKEISEGLGGSAVVGAYDKKIFDVASGIFTDPKFRIEYSSDVFGVAMCGVLKNVYAISIGVAEGLNLGSNMRGWLAMQAIKEMMALVQKLGGRAETVLGQSGFGDFIATGFSPHSKNHTLGKEMAQTGKFTSVSEGYSSLPQFLKKIDYHTESYPILNMLKLVLIDKRGASDAMRELLQ